MTRSARSNTPRTGARRNTDRAVVALIRHWAQSRRVSRVGQLAEVIPSAESVLIGSFCQKLFHSRDGPLTAWSEPLVGARVERAGRRLNRVGLAGRDD